MAKNIFRVSLESAFYFSISSFLAVFAAGFMHDKLEGTSGEVSIDTFVILTLCMLFIFFVLAVSNIVFSEQDPLKVTVGIRLLAILLFVVLSSLVLGLLAWIAWVPIG